MGRPEELDDHNNNREENDAVSDVYTSESNTAIYGTPEEDNVTEADGVFSGQCAPDGASCDHDPYGQQDHNNSPYTTGSCYGPYGNSGMQNGSPYQNSSKSNHNSPYENRAGQGVDPYGNSPYRNGSYGNQQGYAGGAYQNGPCGNRQEYAGGSGAYQNDPYGNRQEHTDGSYQNDPYGNQQGYTGGAYQNNPYGNQQNKGGGPQPQNLYSPYAVPARKNHTRLIIGIVAGIIILFLIAVFALTYKAVTLFSEERARTYRDSYEEQEFHDDREKNREKRREEDEMDPYDYDGYDYFDDDFYDYDYDDYGYDDYGYGYDDYGYGYDDYGYDYDDQYYVLQDDIKTDLTYSVDFEYYEYDTEYEDVDIMVTYPVITGENVPNLAHMNDVIQEEVDLFKDYFEEEYVDYMEDEGSYFAAVSSGFVTYMDEEKLSIVFSEYIYTDYYNSAYLYCINIDMENGVILDNENILSIDDTFSVEFRKQSDIQNGEIVYLTSMTDQEITALFNSPDIIVFYTPKGMEIGFNYDEGWVTVTYEEYEQYLKVF